jgi:hypothetical protein
VDDQPAAFGRKRVLGLHNGYEDQVQALENQARALEQISEDIKGTIGQF